MTLWRMELIDESLNDDEHNTIELVMPDESLFDHLGIDQQERYPSSEAYLEFEGHDPYDFDEDRTSRQQDDDYPTETPPDRDEYVKCDHCGATDRGAIGQVVTERPTSLLTAPARAEYLCPECYAQVVSQYIGLDLYPALVAILLQEHAPVWKISEYHDTDVEDVEEIAISVLAEWKAAYDADEHLHEDERQYITDREHRFLELFPSLGVGQPGIEFDTGTTPDIDLTNAL